MAEPHVIRLRGPWECAALGSGRIQLPASSAALHGLTGSVSFSRRFGMPTGLAGHDQVWLLIEPHSPGTARLNEQSLGSFSAENPVAVDVTKQLKHRNELTLELILPPAVDRLHVDPRSYMPEAHQESSFLEVWLEIRAE